MIRFTTLLLALLTGITFPLAAQNQQAAGRSVRVPFVGCKADGQGGPKDAPTGKPIDIVLPADLSGNFAYYKGEDGFGVLGPKGWNCFQIYGPNGGSLFVTPEPIGPEKFFSDAPTGFSGPAIQLSIATGDTSGRFEVARVIARVFPQRQSFVRRLINAHDGLLSNSDVVYGPYKSDKLVRPDRNTVEFQTPANIDGLGTMSRLLKNTQPIAGVVVLTGETPDAVQLSIRLKPDQASLAPYIIHRLEREVRSTK
ncbi:hypothetical protein FTW19_19575 [Terriglobus albidus]|uniref:Uncharacterized protein n=2 Tax=Terriglobus albidus TaxID=1592106 RepID=A0A5B9EE77_9BACT|nr:hypothetical protein FTW19_19575 [Terriglobus albidus]